jgi:hypothetical protein
MTNFSNINRFISEKEIQIGLYSRGQMIMEFKNDFI